MRSRPETLTGVGVLVRFALRRDRVRLPVWILAIAGTVVGSAASFPELYADPADRQVRAALMANPSAIALGGPQIGVEDYTYGAMLTNEVLGFAAVFVALMSILLVVRHTRRDEEAGRTELIRASVVGRHAPLAAALIVAVGANVAVALCTAVGLGAAGLDSIDWPGSLLFGTAMAAAGIVFAGVAAVTAQVTAYGRGATGMAGLALGAAYALRAVGDIGNDALSWMSPIGWAQRTYAFVDDRWWPLLPAVGTSVALVGAAVALSTRRDVGAGLRPDRPGPPRAADRLVSPLGLALRLHRGSLVSWTVAVGATGLLVGTLVGDVEALAADLSAFGDLLPGMEAAMTEAYLALMVSLLALAAGFHAVQAVLRARTEEGAGRAEPLLAAAVSRPAWLASHVVVAIAGSAAILLAGALGAGVTAAVVLGDGGIVATLLGASLVHLAPILFTVGLAVALYGVAPRASAGAWVVIGYALGVGMLGGLLGLPQWAYDLSPFAAVPLLPAENMVVGPVVVLLALAAALTTAGFTGFRNRDLSSGA